VLLFVFIFCFNYLDQIIFISYPLADQSGAARVTIGGFFAMAVTAGIGVATNYTGADSLAFSK